MTTELKSFDEAAAIAMEEAGLAEPADVDPSLPEGEAESVLDDGQAEVDSQEQADSQTDTVAVDEPVETTEDGQEEADESFFGDLEVEVEEEVAPPLDDDTGFELPGVEGQVTLAELKDGYLRQADYTRKTQEIAEARKTNEKAVGLWDALKSNPEGVVRQLAAQVGLIDEGTQPVKAVEFSPITTQEQMEAEINTRVEAAVREHPAVVEAERAQAVQLIHDELDRIGQANNVKLTNKDKELVLLEAQRRGVADLELVFNNLMSQRERKAQERNSLKEAAPARPTGAPTSEGKSKPADSFEEAAERALIELGLKQ